MKATEQLTTSTPPPAVKIDVSAMPKHETDALCRVLIRSVTEAFKNPAFAAEYEAWLIKRYGGQPQGVNS
ncbi:MAG: hypothetical protein OSJ43_04135 [Oscillospiraceae bacterium]|nr:hypothetical protein [Oscillospiraceae bacterium]